MELLQEVRKKPTVLLPDTFLAESNLLFKK